MNRIITVKEANEGADKLWAECVKQAYAEPDKKEEHMTHKIDSTGAAAVATDYYWIRINKDTPRGVKLQLLGKGGVAQYTSYYGDPFWTHWAPLPKRRD